MLSSQRLWPASRSTRVGALAAMSLLLSGARELRLGRRHHVVDGESESLLELLERSGGAERLHAQPGAARARVALPAERRRLLHRHARRDRGRNDAVAVLLRLLLEELPRGHADHAGLHLPGAELLEGGHAQRDLAAARQQQ